MSARTIIDPVCDMVVDIAEGSDRGLTLEYPEREYAFCAPGCQTKFAKDPKSYIPKVAAWLAQLRDRPDANAGEHSHEATGPAPDIDAGTRAWYKSCRCCLSDAYPQVVAVLDAERAAESALSSADPGSHPHAGRPAPSP